MAYTRVGLDRLQLITSVSVKPENFATVCARSAISCLANVCYESLFTVIKTIGN